MSDNNWNEVHGTPAHPEYQPSPRRGIISEVAYTDMQPMDIPAYRSHDNDKIVAEHLAHLSWKFRHCKIQQISETPIDCEIARVKPTKESAQVKEAQ